MNVFRRRPLGGRMADAIRSLLRRCRTSLILASLLFALALVGSAHAQYAGPVHTPADVERFQTYTGPVSGDAQTAWRDTFLGNRFNRAMAVTPKGVRGISQGYPTEEEAIEAAMRFCADRVKQAKSSEACRLYAVNTRIVYPGHEFALPSLNIAIGDFTFRNEYVFLGPKRAKGVIVWQHGYNRRCIEARKNAAWSVISRFNVAGWDVLRFDRDPCLDGDLAWIHSQLVASVPKLRQAGYKKIVLAGQSRGAWQSVEFLAQGQLTELVDGVLAFSPARHGENTEGARLRAPADWRRLMEAIQPKSFVFATVFFGSDPYVPEAASEAKTARDALSDKGIRNAVIYEDGDDIVPLRDGERNGHSAASSSAFTNRYAACLIRFVEAGEKTGACR